MLKISRQMTEVFRNHMLETCGNTLKTLSNLEICCVMIENKYIFFVRSKFPDTCWKFPDTLQKLVPIWKFSNTHHKSTDTRKKL